MERNGVLLPAFCVKAIFTRALCFFFLLTQGWVFGLWFVCVAVAIPASVFLLCVLSRSQRLSFSCAGVVLAALALERFPVRNG